MFYGLLTAFLGYGFVVFIILFAHKLECGERKALCDIIRARTRLRVKD